MFYPIPIIKQSDVPKVVKSPIIIASSPTPPKFIGYNPINIFAQTEPLNFPIVIMPKPGCVIKFPQKGRGGRKGYKEADFHQYLTRHFSQAFKLYTDRILSVKGNSNAFAPDFAFIDEKEGVNLFMDVEIDEPYEGLNDLGKRKPTHFQYADTDRNNAFKNRGWIVIRFAEIQIHQDPAGCCLFIADVIASIHPTFKIPPELHASKQVISVSQWTKEEALKMSREKSREKYLGISTFGITPEPVQIEPVETEIDIEIEQMVQDDLPNKKPTVGIDRISDDPKINILYTAFEQKQSVSMIYDDKATLIQPQEFISGGIKAYCYVKNSVRNFDFDRIQNAVFKETPFILEVTGPEIGIDQISGL